ncbi:MAG: Crp/Fnr family transcriptional regulator [Chloroflexi bacterium]|nr:Crp/Fnr family transcriptional regulator [Chloroflexota bacterium]
MFYIGAHCHCLLTTKEMSRRLQEFDTLAPWLNLGAAERNALYAQGRIQNFAARQILIKEGAPFVALYVVKAGNVKLCKVCGAKEQILEILSPGDVVDPTPLFDGGNHAVTAKAMTPTQVYRFAPLVAQQLVMEHPAILNALLNVMSLRLRRLAALANDLAFKDVTARVCSVLLEHAASGETTLGGQKLCRPLTRQELAALVGAAREVAWRTLKKLERDGLIKIQGSQIVILDAAGLALRS